MRAEPLSFGRPLLSQVALGLAVLGAVSALTYVGYGLLRGQSGGLGPRTGVNYVGQAASTMRGPAPDFDLQLFDAGRFRLQDHRGQGVVVNFWASWCVPCREEAPVLERGWRDYQGRGVVFVGLDIWDSEKDARSFINEFHVSYPNAPDPGSRTALRYGVTGIPETFFIRPDGSVAAHWIGPLKDAQLNRFANELVAAAAF